MDENKVKETLQKQLELLSERSQNDGSNLPSLTHAMIEIADILLIQTAN